MSKKSIPHKCSVGFCDREQTCGDLCDAHYRQKKRGAPFTAPKRFGVPNDYVIEGDTAYILATRKGETFRAAIDAADLPRTREAHWNVNAYGYVTSKAWGTNGGRAILHRLLTDAPEGMQVDHINGNKLDNRRSNLRVVTKDENAGNRQRTWGGTGVLGVQVVPHCTNARYAVNIKGVYYGGFPTLDKARARRDEVRAMLGLPPALHDRQRESA